jgi:hypothetical protein
MRGDLALALRYISGAFDDVLAAELSHDEAQHDALVLRVLRQLRNAQYGWCAVSAQKKPAKAPKARAAIKPASRAVSDSMSVAFQVGSFVRDAEWAIIRVEVVRERANCGLWGSYQCCTSS